MTPFAAIAMWLRKVTQSEREKSCGGLYCDIFSNSKFLHSNTHTHSLYFSLFSSFPPPHNGKILLLYWKSFTCFFLLFHTLKGKQPHTNFFFCQRLSPSVSVFKLFISLLALHSLVWVFFHARENAAHDAICFRILSFFFFFFFCCNNRVCRTLQVTKCCVIMHLLIF